MTDPAETKVPESPAQVGGKIDPPIVSDMSRTRAAGLSKLAEGALLLADAGVFGMGAHTIGVILTGKATEAMCEGSKMLGVTTWAEDADGVRYWTDGEHAYTQRPGEVPERVRERAEPSALRITMTGATRHHRNDFECIEAEPFWTWGLDAGWYWYEPEYPDEGGVGPFSSRDQAIANAGGCSQGDTIAVFEIAPCERTGGEP